MFTKELFAAILFGITCGSLAMIFLYLWIPSLPRRQRVFIEQCCRRFQTIFIGYTNLNYKACKDPVPFFSSWLQECPEKVTKTIPIPNALIVCTYAICCIAAIILLP